MKIVIVGAGETGTCLAKMLSVENQDIVLMGTDPRRLAELEADNNFITFEGHPLSPSDLRECGVAGADLLVAVTPDEGENLLCCMLARELGAGKCVARVDNPELSESPAAGMLRRHGIDSTIYPERLVADEIWRFMQHNWVSDWYEVGHGALLFAGVRMESDGALCGKRLRDVANNPRLFHVSAIRRGSDIIIPGGDDCLLEGDTVYFSVLPEEVDRLPRLCGRLPRPLGRVMIMGAGRVTENLLALIGGSCDVTVFDTDAERCRRVAALYPGAVVVNARANDVATLNEEGISGCDLFVALTGSSEANIVACMVAREHGVARTVARIEELQYVPEAESLRIDKIVNKKLLNAGHILNVLLSESLVATRFLASGEAEVTGLEAGERSRVVSRPVRDLSLPRGITISGLIRRGRGQLVGGDTLIESGDHVVVLCMSGLLGKAERLFASGK